MNTPDGPKQIVNFPRDPNLRKIIQEITTSDCYIKAPHFRNQLFIIKENFKKCGKSITPFPR